MAKKSNVEYTTRNQIFAAVERAIKVAKKRTASAAYQRCIGAFDQLDKTLAAYGVKYLLDFLPELQKRLRDPIADKRNIVTRRDPKTGEAIGWHRDTGLAKGQSPLSILVKPIFQEHEL